MSFAKDWRVQFLDDEPFCDPARDDAEVLYEGSDDEYYDDPEERRRRIEDAAHRYLSGQAPVLLTSVLRGPFEGPDAKGWVNPWRSRRGRNPPVAVVETVTEPEVAESELSDADDTESCHLPSPRSLDQVGVTANPHMTEEDLERVHAWRSATESAIQPDDEPTWSFASDISLSQSQSHRKRRSMGSDWLKRKDNKRRKAEEEDVDGASIVALPNTQHPGQSRDLSQDVHGTLPMIMDETAQSLPGTQSQSRSSRRALQRSHKSSSQQLPPQTPVKPTASPEEENPAPLSTPIQTPPSAKMSKTTPQTNAREEAPAEVDVEMQAKDTHDSIEVKIEFETQEDESFLFRARPRSRGTAANASVAIIDEHNSSLPAHATPDTESESESESESADEAVDLDGETCFPDDTKATSPESSEAGEDAKDHIAEDCRPETGTKGTILQLAADLASDIAMRRTSISEAADMAETVHCAVDTKQRETNAQGEPVSASQERTIVAQLESPEKKKKHTDTGNKQVPTEQEQTAAMPLDLPEKQRASTPKQSPPQPTPAIVLDQQTAASVSPGMQDLPVSSAAQEISEQSPWSKTEMSRPSGSCPPAQSAEHQDRSYTMEMPMAGQKYTNSETPIVQDDEFQPTPMKSAHIPHSESMRAIVQTDIQRSEEYASSSIQPEDVAVVHGSQAIPASQQSPWKADAPSMAPVRQLQSIRENSQHSFLDPSYQSPWASSPIKMRQAAAEALAFNSFNSPMPASPSPLASSTSANVPTPVAEPVIEETSIPMETPKASTPEPILEIKRFANFMSPSPERPRRRPKRARVSGGHLPSTQNLLAATVNNPWDATPRPAKRVRWAPEVEGGDFPDGSDPVTPLVTRTASPPPELAVADLPTGEDDQFQKHFQAVSRRTKITHRLLPSASQQLLESPGPMAMAEAFVTADALGAKASAAPEALMVAHDVPRASQQPSQLVSQEVDDVDAVLENLNEFIDMCDVQADLERTKEEERQEREKRECGKQEQEKNGLTSSQLFGRFSTGGFLDAGVWD
ncbi:protamine p1 [Colletotrichum camelliae]|nr:protamine p1 [Colletotrichum camelliae]